MTNASPLTPDQRVALVLSLLRKEDSLEALARKAGVSATSLGRWREEFVEAGKATLGSGKVAQNRLAREVDELKGQLAGRDQVIGELLVANRILKKTADLV
jgi:transposase